MYSRATHTKLIRAMGLAVLGGAGSLTGISAHAQAQAPCEVLTGELRAPIGSLVTDQGNLVISETGTLNVPNSGRISIVGLDGTRRTLLDGLPQGTNAAGGDASGPNAITLRGRTLFVAIGQGDTVIPGPVAGSMIPNPNVSSPIFSSVLAIHFKPDVEQNTQGFSLTPQDQVTLAGGQTIQLADAVGFNIQIEMIANFPDSVSEPLPNAPDNVRNSNPFEAFAPDNNVYVTDAGLNKLVKVDLVSHAFADLALFDPIPNATGAAGPPSVEAVPTSMSMDRGELLVSLFSGAPFLPGVSRVKSVHPVTGAQTDVVTGLRTAIDNEPIRTGNDTGYIVLEDNFAPVPEFPPTGAGVKFFEDPGSTGTVVSGCELNRPTSMSVITQSGVAYVTELLQGTVVKVPLSGIAPAPASTRD